MTKNILVLLPLLLLSSCFEKEGPSVPDEISLPDKYSVRVGDPVSLHASWKTGDLVDVFCTQTPETYRYESENDCLRRSGSVKEYADTYTSAYATVPSGASSASEGVFLIDVPDVQRRVEDFVDNASNPMVAVTRSLSDDDLVMHAALGYLRFKALSSDKVLSVTLKGRGGEVIAGRAQLSASYGKIPQVKMLGEGKEIKLDCGPSGVEPSVDALEFTFCVPPTTFSGGVTLTVSTASGSVTYNEDGPVVVSRAAITEIGQTGYGRTFLSFGLRDQTGRVHQCYDLLGPEITVCVPLGADLSTLTPVFAHDGLKVLRDGKEVKSAESPADFTKAAAYTVQSRSGEQTEYTVKVVDCDIPVVHVSTPGHEAITDKVNWHSGSTFLIQDCAAGTIDYGSSSIKGRGNASWNRPKKSYGIKLAVKPKELGVLGLPGHKRWCMIAVQWGYLGNNVGYELARRAASYAWEPHGRYVEFVLNGKHLGTYFLAEQIRIDKNRVNIKSLDPEDVSDEKISGGYLLTYDNTFNDPNRFRSKCFNMPVMIKDPDDDELVPAQFDWIRNYIDNMEESMKDDKRFAAREYADYFDIDTYIDMWFVWELAGATGSHGGADFAHPNSVWFYKDRGGKLTAGPCWDFDSYLFSNQTLLCNKCQYYGRLFQDPVFLARVKQKWPEFRSNVEGRGKYKTPITEFIDSCYTTVKHSAARNQKMWTWTYYQLDTEYETIRNGLPAKMDWLEKQIASFK